MDWYLPGTVIPAKQADAHMIEQQFSAMFMAGGIALGQVANITGLEPYTVQNWVKREFLPPPDHKRYNMNQLCRVITINMLKSVLPMERICGLLSYVNGDLDSEADDIIRDSDLYFLFVKLAGQAREFEDTDNALKIIQSSLENYQEPYPGAKERVAKALRVMLIAWLAARMRQHTEALLDEMTM